MRRTACALFLLLLARPGNAAEPVSIETRSGERLHGILVEESPTSIRLRVRSASGRYRDRVLAAGDVAAIRRVRTSLVLASGEVVEGLLVHVDRDAYRILPEGAPTSRRVDVASVVEARLASVDRGEPLAGIEPGDLDPAAGRYEVGNLAAFPLAPGNQWVYEVEIEKSENVTLTKAPERWVLDVGGRVGPDAYEFLNWSPALHRGTIAIADGFLRWDDLPVLPIDEDAPLEWTFRSKDLDGRGRLERGPFTVDTKSGRHEDCLRVTLEVGEPPQGARLVYWFAPGVGPVLWEVESRDFLSLLAGATVFRQRLVRSTLLGSGEFVSFDPIPTATSRCVVRAVDLELEPSVRDRPAPLVSFQEEPGRMRIDLRHPRTNRPLAGATVRLAGAERPLELTAGELGRVDLPVDEGTVLVEAEGLRPVAWRLERAGGADPLTTWRSGLESERREVQERRRALEPLAGTGRIDEHQLRELVERSRWLDLALGEINEQAYRDQGRSRVAADPTDPARALVERRIDVELDRAEPLDALAQVAARSGVSIFLDPAIEQDFRFDVSRRTASWSGVSPAEALDRLVPAPFAHALRCGVVVVSTPDRLARFPVTATRRPAGASGDAAAIWRSLEDGIVPPAWSHLTMLLSYEAVDVLGVPAYLDPWAAEEFVHVFHFEANSSASEEPDLHWVGERAIPVAAWLDVVAAGLGLAWDVRCGAVVVSTPERLARFSADLDVPPAGAEPIDSMIRLVLGNPVKGRYNGHQIPFEAAITLVDVLLPPPIRDRFGEDAEDLLPDEIVEVDPALRDRFVSKDGKRPILVYTNWTPLRLGRLLQLHADALGARIELEGGRIRLLPR